MIPADEDEVQMSDEAPQIILLPSSSASWNNSNGATNVTIFLELEQAAGFSLEPCITLSGANASASPTCAAGALDAVEGDISQYLTVEDISTDEGHVRCTASRLTLGSCVMGRYVLRYSISSLAGLTSEAFITVMVEKYERLQLAYAFVPDNT